MRLPLRGSPLADARRRPSARLRQPRHVRCGNRRRQHEAAVVVGVLADQVHAAGRARARRRARGRTGQRSARRRRGIAGTATQGTTSTAAQLRRLVLGQRVGGEDARAGLAARRGTSAGSACGTPGRTRRAGAPPDAAARRSAPGGTTMMYGNGRCHSPSYLRSTVFSARAKSARSAASRCRQRRRRPARRDPHLVRVARAHRHERQHVVAR